MTGVARGAVVRVVLAVATVGLLAACSSSSPPSDEGSATTPSTSPSAGAGSGRKEGPPDAGTPRDGGQVSFGLEGEPEGLDPMRYAFAVSGNTVASAVFDPLVTVDANGEPVPYLAKSIEPSQDYKAWTITIPNDVIFHDGTKLTAQIVADNLDAYRKSPITGLAFQTTTSIDVTDDTHLVVKLSKPWVSYPLQLASQSSFIVAPSMLNDPSMFDRPVGTGAFIFDSHTKDTRWSFKKNPSYWRKGLPHLDRIDFVPVPDEAERVRKLQSGDLDVIHTVSPEQVRALRSLPDLKRVEYSGEVDFHLVNTEKPPFDNKTARQAVAYASDTARWRHEQMLDIEQPANAPFAPGEPGYLADNGYPTFDMQRAKDLVKQFEQETGTPLSFTFLTQSSVSSTAEAQFFTALYQEAGMKVELQTVPQINVVSAMGTGNYQMGYFRLFGFTRPDANAVFWRSDSVRPGLAVSLNFPRYQNPQVDEQLDRAVASTDPSVKDKAFQEVSKIWAKDLPYIWLGRPVWALAADPRVSGAYAAANGTVQTLGPKTWISELSVQS